MMPTFFLGPFGMYENGMREISDLYLFIIKKNNSEFIIIINDVLTFIY